MSVWLVKTEPDEFSIEDLEVRGTEDWNGVRNYQARNYLRQMSIGDLVVIYHSSCKAVGIAGVAKVVAEAHPDPSAFDPSSAYFDEKSSPDNPRWDQVTLAFHAKFKNVIPLSTLKASPDMADSPLVKKGSRLSVMPISSKEWECINFLAR